MLVFIIITILILNLLILNLRIGLKSHIDFFENDGFFSVYIFSIPIYRAKAHFQQEDLTHNNIIIKHNKKEQEIHLNTDKNDKQSIVALINTPIASSILIRALDVEAKIGKLNDAFFTTMSLGIFKIAYYSIVSIIKSRQNIIVSEKFTPDYNTNIFEIDFEGIISFSIADIIVSVIKYYLFKNKKIKKIRGGHKLDYRTK